MWWWQRHSIERLCRIGPGLRFVLFGIECALKAELRPAEVERVFSDSVADQVNAKDYLFLETRTCRLTGRVDDYETETIWLRLGGSRKACEGFDIAVARAEEWADRARRGAERAASQTT